VLRVHRASLRLVRPAGDVQEAPAVSREEAVRALTAAGCEIVRAPRDYKHLKESILADTKRKERLVFDPRTQCRQKRQLGLVAAEKEAKRLGNPEIHAYHCVHCGFHHVGKRVA
jgi:hypothetical protein